MKHLASDLDSIIAGLERARAVVPPLEARPQSHRDVTWSAGADGSVASMGRCVCSDGWVVRGSPSGDVVEPCECRPIMLACGRYNRAGVPTLQGVAGCSLVSKARDAVRGLDWGRFTAGRPEAQVRAWVNAALAGTVERHSLLLSGPTGTGKTHIAAGIVRHLVFSEQWRNGQGSARWVRWSGYLGACLLDGASKRRDPAADTLRDGCLRVRLLVVDELKGRREWGATELEDLLDARGTAGRLTVLTTNIAVGALAKEVGDRAESRLVGGGVVVDLVATDYRKGA